MQIVTVPLPQLGNRCHLLHDGSQGIVVDPPRAGLAGKALRRLGRIGAPRIVYVSCNPTTLASDLKTLREDWGYELLRARPVDMFPHTPHVECVALLEQTGTPAQS